MQFGSFKLDKAKGSILAHSLKLENLNIRKGTIITQEHINELVKNNINSIVCARLSNNDIEENKAAIIISKSFSHKSLKFSKSKNGRIIVDDTLKVFNNDNTINNNVYALGDACINENNPLPPLAQVAEQQGKQPAVVLGEQFDILGCAQFSNSSSRFRILI